MKTRDGLRSRHTTDVDVEEGRKYDEDESDSLGDHGHRERDGNKLSQLCHIMTKCIPCAPVQQSMVRCGQKSCSTRTGSFSSNRQRILCPLGMQYSYCQVLSNLLRVRTLRSPPPPIPPPLPPDNRIATTSLETLETDEETPDDWHVGSSLAVPQSPRLPDFSKSRAQLPEKGRIEIEFSKDPAPEIDDNASMTEEDLLLSSQGKPSEEKIIFQLRLSKKRTKERLRNPPVRTFSNNSRSSLKAMVRSGSKGDIREMLRSESSGSIQELLNDSGGKLSKLSRLSKVNRRRGSGNSTENPSRNTFIAPFPKPLSRENSRSSLVDLVDNAKSPVHTPAQRTRLLKALMNSPSGRSDNDSAGDFAPEESIILLNDMSDHDRSRGTTEDDQEGEHKSRGRRFRMNRRGSFVKGSKIERFDSNDPQNRVRRALQRRAAVKNAESYAEWKLDLMANG